MLMGTYEHRLDSKARFVLPAKIREKLGDVVVFTVGHEECVSLYPKTEWENLYLEKIKNLSFYSEDSHRNFMRLMIGSAYETQIDDTGRVLLPANLREYAKLNQEVVISGVGDHAEVWDKCNWEAKRKDMLQNLSRLAKDVGF